MRSLLFVPGDSQRKLAKGLQSGADVILIDLEDSVAASAKPEAREITKEFLTQNMTATDRPRIYVRINDLSTGLTDDDLEIVMAVAPDGVMLPKSLSGKDVTQLDAMLAVSEATHGLEDGATKIIAIVTETAGSLFTLGTYGGASPRLTGMAWGAEDLSASLGAHSNKDETGKYTDPYRLARSLCLAGAVAAEVAPIDTVYTNFRDADGLWTESEAAVRDGYTGKMCIHPAQVDVVNDVFTPSAEQVDRAQRIVQAFEQAGDVGVTSLDGEMLDRPHQKQAQKLLDRARLAGVV